MITATYVNATTFTVSGDQTAEFHVGRRVKHVGNTTGYGTIESVSVPVADTQVVLTAASDNLDASLSGVYYGIVSSYEPKSSIPIHTHDGDEGSGGNIFASPTFTGQATIPTINLTGGQIAFPATAVPSADPNTIDDYEEGTYTITITPVTSGSISLYSTLDLGAYTKIGDFVYVQISIRIESVSSPVGNLRVSVPFTSVDLGEGAGEYTGSIATSGLTISGAYLSVWGYENAVYFDIIMTNTGAAWTFLTATSLHATASNNYFRSSFTYKVT